MMSTFANICSSFRYFYTISKHILEKTSFKMEKIIKETGLEPILEKIFKHLDSTMLLTCLSVCKYWNQAVQNPSLLMWLKLAKMPVKILKQVEYESARSMNICFG